MVGEDELVAVSTRFARLMVTVALNGGIHQAGGRALMAAVRALSEATQALANSDAPEPAEIERVTAEYQRLSARVFAAMKTSKTPGAENVV
jgi:hypothetical protein